EPLVFRPEPATEDYQRLIEEARGVPVTSAAAVPISGRPSNSWVGVFTMLSRPSNGAAAAASALAYAPAPAVKV
ncbi:hypothetical protein GR254_19520, partial [Mycobacterium tuberculosis]|nr:hypothetical protein [Mycobacterium tuberculosis]